LKANSIVEWLKVGIVSTAVIFPTSNLPAVRLLAADRSQPAPCAAPAYHQFDFWAGDWDVFDVGSPIKVAHAQVALILGGCVLREDYQGTDGHKGQSFTVYDSARKIWHQTWVTNRGELLEVEGKLDAGVMILSGEHHAEHTLVRSGWKPMNGEVRETAATSRDGGKTWKPWFDLVFRPATSAISPTSVTDDKKTIAALDAQYQLAVKENDAATMGRILADDFVLVTGSGKTYSKADLLAEARSGRLRYERQDDTNQTVRIWVDTAVMTALLTEKGTDEGKPFDKTVWFSDTYRRTPSGWRYVFGQASLPLPEAPQ
jgi:ketosteroid isomerase-like protein